MDSVKIENSHHRDNQQLTLRFGYDTSLIREVKQLAGVRRSKTMEIYTRGSHQDVEKITNPLEDFYNRESVSTRPQKGNKEPLKNVYNKYKRH